MNFLISFRWMSVFCAITLIIGCGTSHTTNSQRKLDVQTKMSAAVFLEPVISSDKRTVYVQLRNTSAKQELCIEPNILTILQEKGYIIVNDPSKAHYLLQANIIQVGKADFRVAEHALNSGFGSVLGNAPMTATDTTTPDIPYIVIADVQISERIGNTLLIKEKPQAKFKPCGNGVKEITSTERINWKRYQTRIVGTAHKSNLKLRQALQKLTQGLIHSIAGIF